MPAEVQIETQVAVASLAQPEPDVTRDGQDRLTQLVWDYDTLRVTVDLTYVGLTVEIDTYTRTIEDA